MEKSDAAVEAGESPSQRDEKAVVDGDSGEHGCVGEDSH